MATHEPILEPLSPEEPDAEWARDVPTFMRRPRQLRTVTPEEDPDWETSDIGGGVLETHWAPPKPKWTADKPDLSGFYLIRPEGAPRGLWRVVDVLRKDGHFVAAWSDVPPRPVAEMDGFEWMVIREPSA